MQIAGKTSLDFLTELLLVVLWNPYVDHSFLGEGRPVHWSDPVAVDADRLTALDLLFFINEASVASRVKP